VTQFIPMDFLNAPVFGSIIYHPSILPRHRGASAINWMLMEGDVRGGLTIFWADDGLDTGPILLQREVDIDINDTVNGLYKNFLFPEGVNAFSDAVRMIANGTAPKIVQPTEGATYDPIWKDPTKTRINWDQEGIRIHNFIRGNDRVPGAWAMINSNEVTLYGSIFLGNDETQGTEITIDDCPFPAIKTEKGIIFSGVDQKKFLITSVKVNNKIIPAQEFN